MFYQLRELLLRDIPCEIEEKLWAKLSSYFRININAKAILEHKEEELRI